MMKVRGGFLTLLLCVIAMAVSGCGGKSDTDQEVKVEPQGDGLGTAESLDSPPLGISEGRTTEGMLPVYYSFDSSDIRVDQRSRLEVNADFAKEHGEFTIRIEGNADPLGTNEYNMALGERRALSAKKYIVNLGVAPQRLTTVSYGEERILNYGYDEQTMAQNRRADFVVVQ